MKCTVKIRRTWGTFRPTERIHRQGKRSGYRRSSEKRDFKKELDV
jgi:hypothetical protein